MSDKNNSARNIFQVIEKFLQKISNALFVKPLDYFEKDKYYARRYWQERFEKYGFSLKSVGDENLTEQENAALYEQAGAVFLDAFRALNLDLKNKIVVEFGCGTGFYAGLLANEGVKKYFGIDVTNVLFDELRQKFPGYKFIEKDVTLEPIYGKCDLLIIMDTLQYFVTDKEFSILVRNIKGILAEDGVLIVAPVTAQERVPFEYVRYRPWPILQKYFIDWTYSRPVPFKNDYLAIFKNCSIK